MNISSFNMHVPVPLVCYVTVMAGFIQTPVNTSVMLGSTATFTCTVTEVQAVAYLVNSLPISYVAYRGVAVSAPVYSGSQTTVNLHVPGKPENDHTLEIMCIIFLAGGTRVDSRPAAYLSVQG